MAYYITTTQDGHLTGIYLDGASSGIPDEAIQIDEAQVQVALNATYPTDYIYADGMLQLDEAAVAARMFKQNIVAIKAKAGEIISARLPDYKQRNYLARKAELQDILISGGTLSASEQAEWDFFAAEWAWARSVRVVSGAAELAGTPVDEVVWPT